MQRLNALSTGFIHCAGTAIIRSFAGINLINMAIVEVAPAYDHSQIKALAAAHIAAA
ncbi:arginase family protein [Nitrosomonas sp.]|uniref:arginase family protein n=1 Tax=Nitrosomonas sp. TaxID=42353 RepID=UPI00374CF62E